MSLRLFHDRGIAAARRGARLAGGLQQRGALQRAAERIGIGHPGHKDRVTGHVLGNYAKAETDGLSDMLGAIAAEAEWLAKGDDARFMSEVALRLQD